MPRTRVALAAVVVAVAGVPVSADPVVTLVDPLATDPGIRDVELPNAEGFARVHVAAIDPDAAARGRLFLFLPGTGGAPTQYRAIVSLAARLGFDAIGLVYDSDPPVNVITTNNPDPELPDLIRRERLFGDALTDEVDVDRANSVENRLIRALEFLDAQRPGERWGDYLTPDGGVDWTRIVVSGHSQGAGHAAFLAKVFPVTGSAMFAGPGDFVQGFGTAPWVVEPGRTPAARHIALTHLDDPTAAGFFANQRIIGLDDFGPIQNVDGLPVGALDSAMLTSTRDVAPARPHSAVIVDEFVPLDTNGAPVYLAAWTYVLDRAGAACSAADLAAPIGDLDIADTVEFLQRFGAGDPAADLAAPVGALDIADVVAFLQFAGEGCS